MRKIHPDDAGRGAEETERDMAKKEDKTVFFNLSVDCEATQPAVNDPGLGERATRGLAEVLAKQGWQGTFFVIPTEIEAHSSLYKDLSAGGHEVGLHLHPAAQGYEEFCGIYSAELQEKIIGEAADRFAQVMGSRPRGFCMGYGSANDHTYPVLVRAGFTHGTCSMPERVLPECASVWAGAPLFMHYAHPDNRLLTGDLDFVEIPRTVDWESKLWGGKHPQDLRIELVDAKNHFYTIEKSLHRQVEQKVPVRLIHAFTHNTFEYGDPANFRRKTLEGVISHSRNIVADSGFRICGATLAEIAGLYQKRVRKEKTELHLDLRAHQKEQ